MKKFMVLLLACVFIAGSAAGAFAVVYGSAGYLSEGYDESSAWEIDSVETLIKMRDDINNKVIDSTGKFYKLTADLDLTSYADWTPIGYDETHSFKGNFNGNGHNIKIAIERASQENQQYIGLFGFGEGRITIKNLSVSGSINYVSSSQVCAGGIIATLRSATIENCKFDGSITITGSSSSNKDGPAVYAGGIVGYTGSGTISSCKFDGAITILNCSASKENSAGGIVGHAQSSTKITNCSVGSKNRSTIIKSLYVPSSNNKTYAGGIVGYIVDSSRYNNINGQIRVASHGMEVTGNYARLKTVARFTHSLTFGAIEKATTAGNQLVTLGKYSDNTEVNPDDEPTYETTKWEIENGLLTVQHTGSSSDLTFSPIDGTNGTGFKINGDFPEGLTIHLPANWELDVDDGAKVTASDTSKVKEAKDVDGLESPAVKIIGNNNITLNESGIIMTAWYVPSTPSAEIETTSWTKQGSKLIIETNGTPSRYEFDAITSPDTNGDGFKLTGFPSGLKINLPFTWGIDIDTSCNVTVSDESKIIPHTDIPGLPETAHRIMGSNTITLNASDLEMTAFLFTAPAITTSADLGSYSAGSIISSQLKAEGTKWTMKFTAENLPEGLSMTSEGLISGIALKEGTYTFTVKASNCAGEDSKTFTLTVSEGTGSVYDFTFNGHQYRVYSGSNGLTKMSARTWTEAKEYCESIGGHLATISSKEEQDAIASAINSCGKNSYWLGGQKDSADVWSWVDGSTWSYTNWSNTESNYYYEDKLMIYRVSNSVTSSEPGTWDKIQDNGMRDDDEFFRTENFGFVCEWDDGEFDTASSDALTIITKKIPNGKSNETYGYQLRANKENVTWSMEDNRISESLGVLSFRQAASGLRLDPSSGILYGTLGVPGSIWITVTATDSEGNSATKLLTLDISIAGYFVPPIITTSKDLGTYTVGDKVTITPRATGSDSIYYNPYVTHTPPSTKMTLSADSELPPELKTHIGAILASADTDGKITIPIFYNYDKTFHIIGTLTKAGTYDFTLTAENGVGKHFKTFTMTVNEDPSSIKAPSITTASLPDAKAGAIYTASFDATGTAPIEWTSDNLPEGFTLGTSGNLAGLPKTAGVYRFTVTAKNSAGSDSREFTITVNAPRKAEVPKIITKSITAATEGQPYTFKLEAEGINLTWSSLNALPKDLTLSKEGIISGTPKTAGTYRVIFVVKNSAGTDNAVLTLTVKNSSSSPQKPKVKTSKLPDAFIGEEYSYQLEAEGTVDEWKLADGSTLPAGLELNESTGEISGTVTESSAKTFKLKVIAVNEAGESKVQTVSIKVVAKTPYFKTEDLKSATWSKSYSFTVRLANIKAETWSIEGDLPEGIKFEKGKFSGKPKEVGDFDLTITASNGASEITQDFTLKVASIPPKFSGSFKTGTEGKYYECKLKAKGSTPIEWEFDSLPDGLTATPNDTGEICIISGTPEEVFAQSVAITLTNGDNEGDSLTTHKKLTVKAVTPKFETKAKDIPGGTVGETYSYQLKLKANYTPSNVTWTYTGNMPAGLTLNDDGTIYGTPEKAVKNSKFTVYALNAAKESLKAKLTVTMTIKEAKEAEDTRLPVLGENPEGETESTAHEFVNGIAYYERGEITAENLASISNSGEVIVATLPAVEVDTEDLYEFTVSVDKSAPEGGVLVWHSFPDGEYYAGDSEEAYFLDSSNNDIKTVPEDYRVTVHAWLKPGVIYEPVIAVKISHND